MRGGFWRRNVWCLVLAVLVIVVGGLTVAGHDSRQRALDAQESRIVSLEADLDRKIARETEKTDENVFAALGVTASRLDTDEKVIRQVLTTAFTWDSGLTYEQARTQLVERFSLPANDEFVQSFLPPAQYVIDAAGTRTYFLDERGLSSQLGDSLDVDVVSVSGTDYRYVVRSEVYFRTGEGQTTAEGAKVPVPTVIRPVLVHVTVGSDGRVTELTGIPGNGPARTSK